jgi:hypothetical protein
MANNVTISFDLIQKWQKLGYSPQTFQLLLLVPPVQTAWAEGYVQSAERRTIIDFANNELGIYQDEAAFLELEHWLNVRPTEERFNAMNEILTEWLCRMPKRESRIWRNRLLRICLKVAQSSANIGFLKTTFPAIRPEESLQIEKISRLLSISSTNAK